jgi:hypothetical protein
MARPPGEYSPYQDSHKVLSFNYTTQRFVLGADSSVRIAFDNYGMDIGCKRIDSSAFEKLIELWREWKKTQDTRVIQ